ncbi:hypothetical protein H257_17158 [Aphanomyces astaci]|uniref:Uncharacterized protein n=1 Tax=Aphanomyces astaci TaxID=112090 RepID=W4FHN5_APHAT|nr:hypothetical protein H257_17158 [Aphanomyces astaci]ETV66369.1 hypothetical protein H257_17158 [Aphanomyces astaci]|eukprot:XP_009844144.1 hypothetical protein H257_17158 [Aphanomyces astaci]
MFVLDDEESDAKELEKKAQKAKKKTKLTPEEEALDKVRADATEKNMYWAPILLLFPLGPVLVALTTVVFGGVIINAAPSTCNAYLKTFMQGAVGLSYILILFYAYCWIGPRPITKLKILRVFYTVYGIVCFLWWGVFGSLQAATATSTGLNSCLQTAPALFVFTQYQVTIFWLLLCFFMCFAFKEMRSHWTASEHVKMAKQKAADEARAKKDMEDAAAAEVARVQQAKDAAEKLAKAERDRLYQPTNDVAGDIDDGDHAGLDAAVAEDPQDDPQEEEEEEEEEENEGGEEGDADERDDPEGADSNEQDKQ